MKISLAFVEFFGYHYDILWEEKSHMKGNMWKVLAAGTMALTMLAGCSSSSTGKEETGKKLNEGDTVKIGLNFELSGDVSSYGQAERNAAQLAIEQYLSLIHI